MTRPLPPDDRADGTGGRMSIPLWLWLVVSCLVGVATALAVLHLAGAARHLPG